MCWLVYSLLVALLWVVSVMELKMMRGENEDEW